MEMDKGRVKFGRYLMHCIKNDAFVDSKEIYANLGDSIQALAMDSIYEQIGIELEDIEYIKRDYASEYYGERVVVPFYSEFSIGNIFDRLSMSKDIEAKMLLCAVFYHTFFELEKRYPNCYDWTKSMEPVSARDEVTADYLNKNGIDSYLTGCFTICFPKRKVAPSKNKVFFVDIPKNLEPFIPERLKENCEYITHAVRINEYPISLEENMRLENISKSILAKYRDEASLVVTSRLHAAIPCVAMGVPVVFASTNVDFRFSWVEKLFHPYQFEEYPLIDWNPQPIDVEAVKSHFITMIKNSLLDKPYINDLKWLDSFYRDRERTELYMHFKTIIREIGYLHKDKQDFKFLIWGAGYHCGFTLNLMREINPKAVPIAIVDKYKKGYVDGIKIVNHADIPKDNFDHLIISTVPGLDEAIEWHKKNAPSIPYSILISDQKS